MSKRVHLREVSFQINSAFDNKAVSYRYPDDEYGHLSDTNLIVMSTVDHLILLKESKGWSIETAVNEIKYAKSSITRLEIIEIPEYVETESVL